MNMLDHQKAVIEHVIDNNELFVSELKKSLCWLETSEIRKLYLWLKDKYGSSHADLINIAFTKELSIDFKFN